MKINIPQSLRQLASYLPNAYVVGGFVRNILLGRGERGDIDLAGDMDAEEVKRIFFQSPYKAVVTSNKLFTLKIVGEESEFEYTAFRVDSYKTGHSPDRVERTSDITADAMRRDFRINAIYARISDGEICDPTGGLADIEDRVLRVTRDETFCEDGLRLMRYARLQSEMGFSDLDINTLASAKANASLIDGISPERIRDELNKILLSDEKSGQSDSPTNGLLLLDKIGVLERILPEITAGKGMEQRNDFHKYDVFGHTMATVAAAPPEIRLAALMHDVAKPYCYNKFGNFHGHEMEGGNLTHKILRRLRYSNSEIRETEQLVSLHMYALKCDVKENKLRLFLRENYPLLDKLFLLKQADGDGGGIYIGENPSVKLMKETLDQMKRENVPFSVKELSVDGKDLIAENVPVERRGACLNDLLVQCALKDSPYRTREAQLKFLQNYR